MAAADRFWVNITGRGGHAAMPHLSIDPVVAASQVSPPYLVFGRAPAEDTHAFIAMLPFHLQDSLLLVIYMMSQSAHPHLGEGPAKAFHDISA